MKTKTLLVALILRFAFSVAHGFVSLFGKPLRNFCSIEAVFHLPTQAGQAKELTNKELVPRRATQRAEVLARHSHVTSPSTPLDFPR